MGCQHDDRENCDRYGVPVKQAHMAAHIEVGKKRHREISLRVERHAARDVTGGGPEKNREEKIGKNKIEIPITLPQAIVDVAADFERDTAQNQAPQKQKQGQIITRERRRHQAREYCDQCSAETEEPYLMPCP